MLTAEESHRGTDGILIWKLKRFSFSRYTLCANMCAWSCDMEMHGNHWLLTLEEEVFEQEESQYWWRTRGLLGIQVFRNLPPQPPSGKCSGTFQGAGSTLRLYIGPEQEEFQNPTGLTVIWWSKVLESPLIQCLFWSHILRLCGCYEGSCVGSPHTIGH